MSNIRDKKQFGDRLPDFMPARPSFWISALEEPNAPSVGSGDQSPTNIPNFSDESASQSDSTKYPTWNGDRWTFSASNDTFWSLSNYRTQYRQKTVAIVFDRDISTNTRYLYEDRDGSNTLFYLRSRDETDLQFKVADQNGNESIVNAVSVSDLNQKSIAVLTFGVGKRVKVSVFNNGNFSRQKVNHTGAGEEYLVSQGRVGRDRGANTLEGNIYEFIKFPEYLNDNQITKLLTKLKFRHNIGTVNNHNVVNTVPREFPAIPSFWISAKEEPDPPASGNGDEHVCNLIDSSDIVVNQGTSSNQPSWEDGHWNFDGSDDVWSSDKNVEFKDGFVFACVAELDSSDSTIGNNVLCFGSNRASEECLVTFDGDNSRVGARAWTDSNGKYGFTSLSPFEKTVVIVNLEINDNGIDVYSFAINSGDNDSHSMNVSGDFGGNDLIRVGARADTDECFQGKVWECLFVPYKINNNLVKTMGSNLANKWGI